MPSLPWNIIERKENELQYGFGLRNKAINSKNDLELEIPASEQEARDIEKVRTPGVFYWDGKLGANMIGFRVIGTSVKNPGVPLQMVKSLDVAIDTVRIFYRRPDNSIGSIGYGKSE